MHSQAIQFLFDPQPAAVMCGGGGTICGHYSLQLISRKDNSGSLQWLRMYGVEKELYCWSQIEYIVQFIHTVVWLNTIWCVQSGVF